MKMTERLWKTTDGRIVPDGDPDAAFLACTVGEDLTDAELEKRGLKDYHGAVEDKQVEAAEVENKGVSFPAEPEVMRGPGGRFQRKE